MKARRVWQRAKKKKNLPPERIEELGGKYKDERKNLRTEINKAKSSAWRELIGTINSDP